jgi:hypothetical protein
MPVIWGLASADTVAEIVIEGIAIANRVILKVFFMISYPERFDSKVET